MILIIQNNNFQKASVINSTNQITANIFKMTFNWKDYFSLKSSNQELVVENAKLKSLISNKNSNKIFESNYPYNYLAATVINNSVAKRNNYITLDKGKVHGVKKGMGVVTENGVIGIIKETSQHFSSVLSVLHSKSKTSVILKKNNYFGSLEWQGDSYKNAIVKDIPSHVNITIKDTIVTSGYSTIFPKHIPIGIISKINTKPNTKFHDLEIIFLEDFKQLKHVYITKGKFNAEQNKLESQNE